MHFLFERAGNRWTPAMAGRRHQGVIRKYLLEAAEEVEVAGGSLADRLSFRGLQRGHESGRRAPRRDKLASSRVTA